MPWNALANLATGQLVTETHMDQIRENIDWLVGLGVKGSASDNVDRSTTSTTFVDMTNLSVTVTTYGNPILFIACLPLDHNTNTVVSRLDMLMDGASQLSPVHMDISGHVRPFMAIKMLTPSAGSHTFKLQWKTASGTLAMKGATYHPAALLILGG